MVIFFLCEFAELHHGYLEGSELMRVDYLLFCEGLGTFVTKGIEVSHCSSHLFLEGAD